MLPSHISRNGIYVREREGAVAFVCSFVGAFSGVPKTTPGFRDFLEGPLELSKVIHVVVDDCVGSAL